MQHNKTTLKRRYGTINAKEKPCIRQDRQSRIPLICLPQGDLPTVHSRYTHTEAVHCQGSFWVFHFRLLSLKAILDASLGESRQASRQPCGASTPERHCNRKPSPDNCYPLYCRWRSVYTEVQYDVEIGRRRKVIIQHSATVDDSHSTVNSSAMQRVVKATSFELQSVD